MSEIKISQLDQAGNLTGRELVPMVQDNITVRARLNSIARFTSASFANSISAGVGLQLSHPTPSTTLIEIGYIAQDVNNLSNDVNADALSTTKYPSVNAIKTYADSLIVGLVDDRGNYTPDPTSPGAYPSSGGSGAGGAILTGDIWFIDTAGYLGTTSVQIGASVRALVDNPTSPSDWGILDAGLGYIPENVANKSNDGTLGGGSPSTTLYPTQAAVQAYIGSNTSHTLQDVLTAGNTASNQYIELDSATSYTYLNYEYLYVEDNGNEGYYGSTDTYVYDGANGNYIESYVYDTKPLLTVHCDNSNTTINISDNYIQFNNSGYGAGLFSANLTSGQTWTLPDASGTIALTSNVWSAVGNAGTVAGTNFLGTTDAIDFVAKTNNTERLRILSTGQVKLSSLTGTGTRMVVANASGQLSAQAISSPTLQTVTNAGNTTTNNIISNGLVSYIAVQNPSDSSGIKLEQIQGESGYLHITKSTGEDGIIDALLLTGSRNYQLPDQDGTFALLSDINGSNFWGVTGNAGTNPLTDFIGTTDNVDFVTKTNNIERLRVLGTGELQITNLAGTGTRMVVADSVGQLSTQAIASPTLQVVTSGTNKNLTDGINLQGTNAGNLQTGTNVNAFGSSAAANNTGSYVNAIGWGTGNSNTGSHVNGIGQSSISSNTGSYVNALGRYAAQNNTGSNVNALGYNAAKGNLFGDVNALGTNAALNNAGQFVNAIGNQTASGNSATHVNALGQYAAFNNLGVYTNAMGISAAQSNQGQHINAFGNSSAQGNTGNYVNALGNQAAQNNSGIDVNAFGTNSAYHNSGFIVNAIGNACAFQNTGSGVNAFGISTAQQNTGNDINAIGNSAALQNTADNLNAFGYTAGYTNTGSDTNGIGRRAAFSNSGQYVNAIGLSSAESNSGDNVNALGYEAAMNNTVAGTYVNAFGYQAAKGNSGGYVNAIGSRALENNTGSDVNAFGNGAGSGNTINGATIFSNASMPSYANYAAASVALASGTVGCTYLYHDQATNSIGAVRL